eukprot:TRINITY_DN2490_c0_g3_i3.p1 TRINITY_DN2490_c0_g3~~TRINITY_DN2490_c0_g3_i3.p1  ORF type:complete len:702 (+),score=146.21 TRINITY_DN2490_c0_g3_i3:82-2187(+)
MHPSSSPDMWREKTNHLTRSMGSLHTHYSDNSPFFCWGSRTKSKFGKRKSDSMYQHFISTSRNLSNISINGEVQVRPDITMAEKIKFLGWIPKMDYTLGSSGRVIAYNEKLDCALVEFKSVYDSNLCASARWWYPRCFLIPVVGMRRPMDKFHNAIQLTLHKWNLQCELWAGLAHQIHSKILQHHLQHIYSEKIFSFHSFFTLLKVTSHKMPINTIWYNKSKIPKTNSLSMLSTTLDITNTIVTQETNNFNNPNKIYSKFLLKTCIANQCWLVHKIHPNSKEATCSFELASWILVLLYNVCPMELVSSSFSTIFDLLLGHLCKYDQDLRPASRITLLKCLLKLSHPLALAISGPSQREIELNINDDFLNWLRDEVGEIYALLFGSSTDTLVPGLFKIKARFLRHMIEVLLHLNNLGPEGNFRLKHTSPTKWNVEVLSPQPNKFDHIKCVTEIINSLSSHNQLPNRMITYLYLFFKYAFVVESSHPIKRDDMKHKITKSDVVQIFVIPSSQTHVSQIHFVNVATSDVFSYPHQIIIPGNTLSFQVNDIIDSTWGYSFMVIPFYSIKFQTKILAKAEADLTSLRELLSQVGVVSILSELVKFANFKGTKEEIDPLRDINPLTFDIDQDTLLLFPVLEKYSLQILRNLWASLQLLNRLAIVSFFSRNTSSPPFLSNSYFTVLFDMTCLPKSSLTFPFLGSFSST